jgi:Family of unknown function (DUF6962)
MPPTEPITALTDYAIAVTSCVFAASMYRRIGPGNRVSAWFWCAAFLATAGAAIAGGTFHGFRTYFRPTTLETLWNVTLFLIGGVAAFVVAAIRGADVRREDHTVEWLAGSIAVTLAGLTVQQSDFPRGAFFNHNDVYHLIQIVALYLLFRCARTTRDRGSLVISSTTHTTAGCGGGSDMRQPRT